MVPERQQEQSAARMGFRPGIVFQKGGTAWREATDYIRASFDDFMEFHGDRYCKDDGAIVGGIASFHGMPVTVIGQEKGKNTRTTSSATSECRPRTDTGRRCVS